MPVLTRHDSYASFVAVAVRRNVVILVVCALLGFAAAFGYAKNRPVTYTATASVLPAPVIGNPLGADTSATNATQLTVAILTEAGLVDTPAVAELASKRAKTDLPRPGDVVATKVPPNTAIIKIGYTSATPEQAMAGAQAFADGFLDYRRAMAESAQQSTLTALHQEFVKTKAELRRATAAADAQPIPNSFAAQREAIASAQVKSLKAELSSTRSLSTEPGRSVTHAVLPTRPNGLSPAVLGLAGAVLGLLIGLGLAVWREARRDGVDSRVDDDVAGVPLLARVGVERGGPTRLLTSEHADDEEHDAYRRLRSSLLASAPPPHVLAVTSLSSGVSAAGVTANLGVMLARAGFKVTLIEAVPDGGEAGRILGADPGPGLSQLLDGATQLGRCLQAVHGIDYIAPGPGLDSARERLAGPVLGRLVGKLGRGSDYVLLVASDLPNADAEPVLQAAQRAVLIVEDGVTPRAGTSVAIERLSTLGVSTVGAVATTRVKKRRGLGREAPQADGSPTADPDPEDDLPDRDTATEGPGIPTHV